MDSDGDTGTVFKLVLAGDLSLGVWPSPPEGVVAPEFGQLAVECMSQDHGQRHALLSLVSCVAKHETLMIRE